MVIYAHKTMHPGSTLTVETNDDLIDMHRNLKSDHTNVVLWNLSKKLSLNENPNKDCFDLIKNIEDILIDHSSVKEVTLRETDFDLRMVRTLLDTEYTAEVNLIFGRPNYRC